MQNELVNPEVIKQRKKRLELGLIGLVALAVTGLTILEINVVRIGLDIPLSNNILYFSLINVNAVLLIYLIFLVLRNLYRLFLAPERELIGAKLRTKLVVAFISLSLGPTVLIFFTSVQFITTSHDYWFKTTIEQALTDSLQMGQSYMDSMRSYAVKDVERLKTDLAKMDTSHNQGSKGLQKYLKTNQSDYNFSRIIIYSKELEPEFSIRAPNISPNLISNVSITILKNVYRTNVARTIIDSTRSGDVVHVIVTLATDGKQADSVMAVSYHYPLQVRGKMEALAHGLDGYRELKEFREPIKISQFITLALVALLIIFASTWFGFRLANGITGPISELAEGTQRIAAGDYDFSVDVHSSDEIGTLVTSFNRMTRDLKASKEELIQKNVELTGSYAELDQRRRYMEIVLQNIAAGVVSTDAAGRITTINNSAEEILKFKADEVWGRNFRDLLPMEYHPAIEKLLDSAKASPKGSAERQARIEIENRVLNLNLHLNLLVDDRGQDMGLVMVFNDLTELEKAQRMAAWRDMARRIAHEIKNPLTPIQLSTQRLRKRYGGRFKDDDQVFKECTRLIIRQVEELKRLVDEFSNFARMPGAQPTPNDLSRIVRDSLVLYREGHPEIDFTFETDPALPVFKLDPVQIKRVLANLLDNAVTAVNNMGRIEVNLSYDEESGMARVEVADDGPGVDPQNKDKVFEPYFSTKKSGTGLGLAIVSTIVADHNGVIRVDDRQPNGARFTIEIPVVT